MIKFKEGDLVTVDLGKIDAMNLLWRKPFYKIENYAKVFDRKYNEEYFNGDPNQLAINDVNYKGNWYSILASVDQKYLKLLFSYEFETTPESGLP